MKPWEDGVTTIKGAGQKTVWFKKPAPEPDPKPDPKPPSTKSQWFSKPKTPSTEKPDDLLGFM